MESRVLAERWPDNPSAGGPISSAQVATSTERGWPEWASIRIQDWVRTTLNKELYLSRCYEFLDAVGYSRQLPRPRHVEADQERQEDFKKKSSPRLSTQLKRVLKALDDKSKSGAWTSTESA